ncbi:MAG: IS66 family transposase [Chloroflexi bacterium]|nr:IS66 family transposase [Chloroflexota bacterium]
MSDECVPAGVSADDWAATPASVRAVVLALQQTVAQLTQRVSALAERVQQTSQNSSKPPSSDPPSASPRPQRTPSGRQAGGQPGHVGHTRVLKPARAVKQFVDFKPPSCAQCGALLMGDDPAPERRQVTELPPIPPEVTEYRRHALTCLVCQHITAAAWPAELPDGSFGPRVQATVGYLTGRLGVSQRDIEEVMDSLFHVDVSLGSVAALEQDVSAALAQPVAAAQTYVQAQPAVNADETSWREGKARYWVWLAATPWVAVFLVLASRGAKSAKQLLGAAYAGIVGSDRWTGYNWLATLGRQLCWAHLKRDFQAILERGGADAVIGEALLAQTHQVFDLWYRVRDGTLSRAEFQTAIQPIQKQVHELLQTGATLTQTKTARRTPLAACGTMAPPQLRYPKRQRQ